MSQTHLHAEKAPPKRNKLADAALFLFIAIGLVAAFIFGIYWEGCVSEREFADARILDTRLAVTDIHQGLYGTKVSYRIEAHVTYGLHGQMQDRWVPVSEIVTDRTLLEARLASHPKTCEVSWPKSSPENARCQLSSK
jgi:hypothetical protein